MNVQLRPIRESDHERAAQIVFDAFGGIARQHNFPLDMPQIDVAQGLVKAFSSHPAVFAVAAEGDGQLLGVNFLDCRTPAGGVGPICVNPGTQQKGVGRKLMEAVVADGRQRGLKSIRLVQDAFNTTSMSLYTSVGFDAKEPLALMRGTPKGTPAAGATVRPVTDKDLDACAELCRAAHGFDRTGELRESKEMFHSMLLERNGRIVAYASAPTFWILNHAVAASEQDLFDLVLGCGAASGAEPLSMLVPIRRANLFRWLLAQGVRVVKPMTLMSMGEYQEPETPFWPSVQF